MSAVTEWEVDVDSFAALAIKKPDSLKRVNYPFGLVLGVDEFVQEQAYLLEQDRGHNRLLHGYGTVWGLGITVPHEIDLPEVRVAPGAAIVPAGMRICVPHYMCAKLNDWLGAAERQKALREWFGDPEFELSLCVVLCYRECQTDIVPLPGEPCRSEEETRAPSRIQDSFELKLCVHDEDIGSPPGSPPQAPEDSGLCICPVHTEQALGVDAFTGLLRRIVVKGSGGRVISRGRIEKEVRAILDLDLHAAPNGSGGELVVRDKVAPDMVQAAIRIWVTEVLPELMKRDLERLGRKAPDPCEPLADDCVLLGNLTFTVTADWTVKGGPKGVVIDDTDRPVLLPTRVLQEWIVTGGPVDKR